MKIKKAVIAAAAPDQSQLPFQSLIDRQGKETTALQLIVEEAIEAGIEEICIIIQQGNRESFAQASSPKSMAVCDCWKGWLCRAKKQNFSFRFTIR